VRIEKMGKGSEVRSFKGINRILECVYAHVRAIINYYFREN